ncbi:proton channel OTOP2-like [Malaclemys terrapin pileata]|uniref:proton channel OTOP2-like n=1 Tax=Malaclemys terrapin pileata TaxID=2991368 RepID=UPI0023A7BDE5|nr:proton channel OTOP2-like [Malaclemys terrapin pileata]
MSRARRRHGPFQAAMIPGTMSNVLQRCLPLGSPHPPEGQGQGAPDSPADPEGAGWQDLANARAGSLLSLLYLVLLTFLGSAVLLAEIHQRSPQSRNVHGFLATLMLTSCAWMLWFGWRSSQNKRRKLHQDHHAGASWLKGGLSLFALATLVLDCLSLGYYYELQHCTSVLITAFPVVQAVFTIIQVSLLSFHAKVCIQEQQHLNRFGLMHTLATNVLMWMSVVLDESMKQLQEIYDAHETESPWPAHGSSPTNSCSCATSLCHIFSEGAAYLHPFNIEFSLFSSTMLYVVWKNTGQAACRRQPRPRPRGRFHLSGAFVGLVLGALAISATFGVMISFGVLAKAPETVPEALRTYYIFNSVLLSAMFLASLVGIAAYRLQRDPASTDCSKSVVRSLDVTLLLGSSCGPLMVSVFSLVAIFFLHINGSLHLLDLCFSLCKTIQVLGQNLFITEALYSRPAHRPDAPDSPPGNEWVFSISGGPAEEPVQQDEAARRESNCAICPASRHTPARMVAQLEDQAPGCWLACSGSNDSLAKISAGGQQSRPSGEPERISIRRKILQNISILLIFYNISVWILYAYGTRPHLVSQIEQAFYGFTLWVIIVKISLPLGIFYRMHSVASLFEVYCKTC